MFQESLMGVSMKYQGYFMQISWVMDRKFQESFKSFLRVFEGVLREFQGCFEEVLRMIQGSF